jgi:hypothetical protein
MFRGPWIEGEMALQITIFRIYSLFAGHTFETPDLNDEQERCIGYNVNTLRIRIIAVKIELP